MSHALVWSEIDPLNLNSELKKEIQVAGFGTNISGTWTKKVFELKWINSSVSDVRLWLDNTFAEIYEGNSEFSTYAPNDLFDLNNDLIFDFRAIRLNNNNVTYLPPADVATSNYFTYSGPLFQTIEDPHFYVYQYIDGHKININSKILLKDLSRDYTPIWNTSSYAAENGLYKVVSDLYLDYSISKQTYQLHEILTAGRIVSVGQSSYFHWFEDLVPGETYDVFYSPSTKMRWVNRNDIYELDDVNVATTENLPYTSGSIAVTSASIDNYSLELNDRVLVKDQTDATQNGIYYVSSVYTTGNNKIINPNTSTDLLDAYWDEAVFNISQGIPVSARVGHGTTYGGRYYRFYKNSDSIVTPFLVEETNGDDNFTSGFGSTLDIKWTNATHFYSKFTVDWYYAVGATEGYYSNQTLYNMPTNITDFNGVSTLTQVGQSVLVKHPNPAYNGIWQIISVGNGNTSEWGRPALYNNFGVNPLIIETLKSRTSIGSSPSPFWYHGKQESYKLTQGEYPLALNPDLNATNRFILDLDYISVDERYIPWRYQEASNLITSEILDFNSVNEKIFTLSGVGLTERILVAGQATTASQNGLYFTGRSSLGYTEGLEFKSGYELKNGLIFQDLDFSASGNTYFLFTPIDNISAGSTSAKFVDMSNPTYINTDVSTTKDKFTNDRFISPDDFTSNVSNNDVVLVNTSNKKINGIYDATLGTPEKAVFDYSDNYIEWLANIYRNILNNKTSSKFVFSTNFKKETDGILLARNTSGFGITTFYNSKLGNIYVPEISFASNNETEKFFSEEFKGSALSQELNIDWYEQDYQKYSVQAVYNTNTIAGFPLSAGTAISNTLSSGDSLLDYEDILVYIGNGISSESSYNGIYRATLLNDGINVYFTKHEDFDQSTDYISNTHIKSQGSPYERPTKVNILKGYLINGASFGYSTVYMQGVLSQSPYTSQFGSTSVNAFDENQYHAGIDFFVKNSNVRLSVDYSNLFNFPKSGPVSHFIVGDLQNRDTVNGDILIVNRGYQLFTNVNGSSNNYYYEIGDRVIYQDNDEELYFTDEIKSINGIYVITHIDQNNWTYYLRRVKQNASAGHIDYFKRLDIHPSFSLNDIAFSLTLYGGNGSTYHWSRDNYVNSQVFLVGADNTVYLYDEFLDYLIIPEQGLIGSYLGWPDTNADFYCYIYQDKDIPRYNEVPKSLKNRYYNIDQITKDKTVVNSGNAISTSFYEVDKNYLQLTYNSGNANTSDLKYNNDRINWYTSFDSNKNYLVNLSNVVEIGSTNSYFVTSRQSPDGLNTTFDTIYDSNYYDTNLIDPGTGKSQGLYTGSFYFEKLNVSGSGFSVMDWYSELNLNTNDNILILNNNSSSIALTYQTSYYNDENVLVKHIKSGKQDQKLLKYKEQGFTPVTLTYNSGFGATLSPIIAISGINTYFLHYDPDFTDRSTDERSWYDLAGATKFEYDVESNSNISDINDVGASLGGYAITEGNVVLLKDQLNLRENGLYTVVKNNLYKLTRTYDLSISSQIKALGRVNFNDSDYELILPNTNSYTLGSTSGNTPLVWKKVGYGQTIDVEVATFNSYNNFNISGFPSTIDNKLLFENDKVLLLSQSSNTEKYIGRFNKIYNPVLSRVVAAGATNTAGFAITCCYVTDTNRNKTYEIYFSGARVAVGQTANYWFEQGFIEDYQSADYYIDYYVGPDGAELPEPLPLGSKYVMNFEPLAYVGQNNMIYVYDYLLYYLLQRDNSLNEQEEFTLDKRVKVLNGNDFSGIYSLIYDEDSTFVLNNSELNWVEVPENYNLKDCRVATTENINLASPSNTIDNITLNSHDRILVKSQTDKTENGIYIVTDLANNNWVRSEDLNTSDKIHPQTTLKITEGETNGGKIFRIKLPFGKVGYDYQFYELDVDDIDWVEVDGDAKFYENPENWQKIGIGTTTSFYLGTASMDKYGVSHSDKFAIAIKSPSSSKFSGNGITQSGKIRNLKFKVEYNTVED